jgi:hypothetical protein
MQRTKSHFLPPYYQHNLRLKLQTLNQGYKGVGEYYQELIIGLAYCNIHEDDQNTCAKFFVVCIMIYKISLTIKIGPGLANCIILL